MGVCYRSEELVARNEFVRLVNGLHAFIGRRICTGMMTNPSQDIQLIDGKRPVRKVVILYRHDHVMLSGAGNLMLHNGQEVLF